MNMEKKTVKGEETKLDVRTVETAMRKEKPKSRKTKKKLRKELNKVHQRTFIRDKKQHYNNFCKYMEDGSTHGKKPREVFHL